MINILSWLAIIVLICYVRIKLGNGIIGLIDFLDDLSKRNRKQ